MTKQGSYNVNENASKKSSFKSFICALLVFLFLCIVLYLILMFSKTSKKGESLFQKSEKYDTDRLANPTNAPLGTKKNEDTTTYRPIKTTDVSKKKTLRDPSKLRSSSTTEYYTEVGTGHSISPDTSSTDNWKNEGEGLGNSTDISQSTHHSVESNESFLHDSQSSNDMTTENVNLSNNPRDKGQSTEAYKDISERAASNNAKGTTNNFFSITDLNSEEISTTENFGSTTSSSTMSQLNEPETIRRFTDYFMSSTEINPSESPIVPVSDTMNFDFTTNSATTAISIENESITIENSAPLSTTDVAKQDEEVTKTFTDTFQTSTESNLLENIIVLVSDSENYDLTTNSATPMISKESITTENNFQSSTEIGSSSSPTILVSGYENFKSTTTETVTASIKKSIMKKSSEPLSTTENYVNTIDHFSSVKVCNTAICDRATSHMLNFMNHAADPCEDFYEFACGEQHSDNNEQLNLEELFKYLPKNDSIFTNLYSFHQSCVIYGRNFNLTERIKMMEYQPNNNLTDLFVELILTQSMPFFDIGLDINHTQNYSLQITLPGRSSLRASIGGWSVIEQIRKACLNEQRLLMVNSEINLNEIYTSFKACQMDQLKNSVKNFVGNMQLFMSQNNNSYPIYNDDDYKKLLDLLERMQDLIPSELEIQETQERRKYKLSKIEDLYDIYDAVDWKVIFGSLTFDGIFDENDIQIYFYDNIKNIFNMLQKYKESELVEILGLYSKFQLYENIVIPKDKENREMYCMELSNQIMPDVFSIIVYKRAKDNDKLRFQNRNKIITLFNTLKSQFSKSLETSTLNAASKTTLQNKLDLIELGLITTVDYNATRDNYKEIAISANKFEENVLSLLGNYRKIIYSLKGKEASAGSLFTYFVDPFYTGPKTFYPSKYIVFHPTIFQRTSMDLPQYIILSQIGFHLSQELAKHFDSIEQDTDSQNSFYNYLILRTDALLPYLANNTYQFEGKSFNFQVNNKLLWISKMIGDNTAFRLIEDVFDLYNNQENLPWVDEIYPFEKVFFITAVQGGGKYSMSNFKFLAHRGIPKQFTGQINIEYCKKTTAINFMEDIYQTGQLPPHLRIQNILTNSKKFSKIFECPDGSMHISDEQKTQFPYVNFSEEYEYYDHNPNYGFLSNN